MRCGIADVMPNNHVLVAGGDSWNGSSIAGAELYDFLTNIWSATEQ